MIKREQVLQERHRTAPFPPLGFPDFLTPLP